MKDGIYYAFQMRLASILQYCIMVVGSLLIPAIVIIIYYSVQGSNEPKYYTLPSVDRFKCPEQPCVNFLYGARNNATAIANIERMIDSLGDLYNTQFTSIKVDNLLQLVEYFTTTNRGKVGIALYEQAGELLIYSRDKQSGKLVTDSQLLDSAALLVKASLDEYPLDKQKTYFTSFASSTSMSPLIMMLGMFFLITSFIQVQVIAYLKDKRRYEYLLCNGLRRVSFWAGMMVVEAAESCIILIILSAMLTFAKFLSTDLVKAFFLPLFGIFSILAQNVAFLWFVASFTNTIMSLTFSYILIATIGYLITMMLQMLLKPEIYDIVGLVMQILLPFVNVSRFFQQLWMLFMYDTIMVQTGSPALGFWEMLGNTDMSKIPLWCNPIVSVVSGAIFVSMAILIEATNKLATYPTRRSFRTQKISQQQREMYKDNFHLQVNNLKVEFKTERKKKIVALDGLNLDFRTNRATIGLIAENGAGKTTLFRAAMGAVRPVSGSVSVNGVEAIDSSADFYDNISVVFQENIVFTNFTVQKHMQFMSLVIREDAARIPKCLEQMGLSSETKKRCQKLSGGMQRRLNIAVALLKQHPQLYMFDEPACGVDIESRKFLWNFLKDLKVMTLITTHAMEEVEEICDKVIMLKKGKLVIQGDLFDVKRKLCFGYRIKAKGEEELPQFSEADQQRFQGIQHHGNEILVPYAMESSMSEILRALDNKCIVRSPSLTEAFLNVQNDCEIADLLT